MTTMTKLKIIYPCIKALMGAGNLSENEAKTLVYYAVTTWSDKPRIRPIIDLNGESGTGKSGLLKQMGKLCRDPKLIMARNITPPQLRNQLADTITAFIEEADKTSPECPAPPWHHSGHPERGIGSSDEH